MDFAKLTPEQLIEKLGDRNNWARRQARRQLVEKIDAPTTALLHSIVAESAGSRRLDALWVLISASKANDRLLSAVRQDKDPVMRLWAARATGEVIADLRARLGNRRVADLPEREQTDYHDLSRISIPAGLTADPEPSVRLAAAIAMRQAAGGRLTRNDSEALFTCWPAIPSLIERGSVPGDRTLPFVIWTSIEPLVGQGSTACLTRLQDVAPKAKPLSLTLTHKTMRRLCDTRKPGMIDLAIDFVSKVEADGDLLASALEGLVKGQEAGPVKPTRELTVAFDRWSNHGRQDVRERATQLATMWGDPSAVKRLLEVALDAKAKSESRLNAVKTLRKLRSENARVGIRSLIGSETDTALLTESMRAAAEIGGDEFPALIVKHWTSKSPVLRTTAAEVLLSRENWAAKWLDAVEAGGAAVDAAAIPNTARRYFATAATAPLKARAEKVLGKWNETPEDVKKLIADKRKVCLDGEPDFELGRTIFTSACATCHKFHGGGVEVGPDLIGSGRSNLDALLSNVLDPNQIIGRGYENFVVTTKDGRTLTGRLIEDTPTRVRLLGITAREEVVARDQIAKIENTGQSAMPMGFAALPNDQFRSLIWFVLAPPDEGPLTREEREALSRSVDGSAEAHRPEADATGETAAAGTLPIDWESVSLWASDWKVVAPEFEGTPRRRAEFHGRKNVLEIHPFPETRKNPAFLEHTAKLPADRPARLSFEVASHDRGDFQLIVSVDGRELKRELIGHNSPRWRNIGIDLAEWKGQAPKIRIEAWANNWSWEFAYLAEVKIE